VPTFLQSLRRDWRAFADAPPGKRFCAYHRRARQQRSTFASVGRIALGVVLCAGGVVLWFLPGPGWLLILFGMAMFAGESARLARTLDELEIAARDRARRLLAWWRRRVRVQS
jgi:hypothetical protein